MTERYRKYERDYLPYDTDLKWFEEAIRGIKEIWEQVKDETVIETESETVDEQK